MKGNLNVFRSRDGKYVRFCLELKGDEMKGYGQSLKLKTDDGTNWYVHANGITPYIGVHGFCYNTRRKMDGFEGMKPGEERDYSVDVEQCFCVKIKEKQ